MAFIPLRDLLSIWHFKLIWLIGPRAMSERVNTVFIVSGNWGDSGLTSMGLAQEIGFTNQVKTKFV
jgi:hypothetical protein